MNRLYLLPFLLVASLTSFLFAQDATEEVVEISMVEALLALVKENKTQEQAVNDDRENKSLANKNKQASILAAEVREFARQEKIADTLEAEYKKNEEILRVKEDAYKKELGSLVELFGHLQTSASENSTYLQKSATSIQYGKERVNFLNNLANKMSETTELPTIREIEGLWYELLREIIASAQVVSFTTDVIDVDGVTSECSVTRVGLFNAVCDGKYLGYSSTVGQYAFLPRQPAGRYTKTAKAVGNADVGDQVKFWVDPSGPSGGHLLSSLVNDQKDKVCDIFTIYGPISGGLCRGIKNNG